MEDMGKMPGILRKNARYFLAAAVLIAAFLIARGTFTTERKNADDCQGGKCLPEADFELSDRSPSFYADDVLKGKEPGYYRLSYRVRSGEGTKVSVLMATYLEKEQSIGESDILPSDDPESREILFRYPGEYSNVVFRKADPHDGAGVSIADVRVSKLDVSSEAEFASLKPTVFGRADVSKEEGGQSDSSYAFSSLKTPKTTLIQSFRAESGYISGVALKMDVIKDIAPSSKEYVLSLKAADTDGGSVIPKGSTLAQVKFSADNDLERYRQADGTFRFPLFAVLEKGASYALLLDNSKVDAGDSDYLAVLGSGNDDAYVDGTAAVKQGKSVYRINGDWYFRIYGASFEQYAGQRLLAGVSVSDLGRGVGEYRYGTQGTFSDILDLDSAKGVSFDPGKKVLLASSKDGNGYSYRFHIGHPVTAISFKAESVRPGWSDARVYYSFDGNDWSEIPSVEIPEQTDKDSDPAAIDQQEAGQEDSDDASDDSGNENDSASPDDSVNSDVQRFDFEKEVSSGGGDVYLRVVYDPESANKTKYFGLRNLGFSAEFKNE